jgi:hypothetical protein
MKPIKSSATGIKDQGRYVSSRANERGERQAREPLNEFGERGSRESFQDWAEDQAERGRIAHALTLNPGEGHVEKDDLEHWAKDTLERLEWQHAQDLEYQLWVHDDHTRHAHVHGIVTTAEPIPEEVARELRFHAGEAWQELQALKRDLEMEHTGHSAQPERLEDRTRLEERDAERQRDHADRQPDLETNRTLERSRSRPEIGLER